MPALTNIDRAVIEAEKIRDYLLQAEHEQNGGKARFFEALGFSRNNWEQLAAAFRQQHLPLDATESTESRPADAFGVSYQIVGPITGPRRSGNILSAWIVRFGEDFPRFVTARPVS